MISSANMMKSQNAPDQVKYYCVGEINVTDPSWVSDYLSKVTVIVKSYGGRYLARTSRFNRLEGDRPAPGIFLLIEWPSKQVADAFYSSVEYAPYLNARLEGAVSFLYLVAGEDISSEAK